MAEAKTSDKIYSVSELNALAGATLERNVGAVWVRGEVTGLKVQPSGHVYFSLKDAGSVVSVAFFKGSALKTSVKLEEGKQILVFGEVGIYLPRGSYQLVARFLLDEGAGRLQQEFERLKKQLEGEGLFAKEKKIEIPRLPRIVAFITSPTGAVWQDFAQILSRRDWRGRAILFPTRVQGPEAPDEIIKALQKADKWPGVELIVVGRGGGSMEDLWAFNDERVVRAVAALQRPVISAIGHETDFSLCDFAADFRAETPSAAAEIIAGFFNDARAQVGTLDLRIIRSMRNVLTLSSHQLRQLFDRLRGRSPKIIIERNLQRIDETADRLRRSTSTIVGFWGERLKTLSARLDGLDPAVTLRRGYVMVRGAKGNFVTRAALAKNGENVTLEFSDGQRSAKLD